MKLVSGKHFARILESRGWNLIRVNGRHHVYMQAGNFVRISLPIHGNEDFENRFAQTFYENCWSYEKRAVTNSRKTTGSKLQLIFWRHSRARHVAPIEGLFCPKMIKPFGI